MSEGLLGSTSPSAATDTVLYTCPASKKAVLNLTATNTTSGSIAVRIGIKATNAAFATSDWVFYDYTLPPNGAPLNWTGIVLGAGNTIKVRAASTGVNFQVTAIESNA
jgi:hypothetical protein